MHKKDFITNMRNAIQCAITMQTSANQMTRQMMQERQDDALGKAFDALIPDVNQFTKTKDAFVGIDYAQAEVKVLAAESAKTIEALKKKLKGKK